MIKSVNDTVIAFDCEWIPDAQSARLLFGPEAAQDSDEQALQRLWAANGATSQNPRPFVRLMQSRVVSIAMLMRIKRNPGDPAELRLTWLPQNPEDPNDRKERNIVGKFLTAVGKRQPQLVGFNSRNSDLRILAQRALALGIPAKTFFSQPDKPWDAKPDYLAKDNAYAIDLMDLIEGGFTRNAVVNLHEAATLSGIPGKFNVHGDDVLELWQQQAYRSIVQYNCFDAITTYLLWLRLAWISGHFSTDEYLSEQELLRQYLMELTEKPETAFIEDFINEWDRLDTLHQQA